MADAPATTVSPGPSGGKGKGSASSSGYYFEIFLVSVSALLLEISYTRIVSFKLFYYFTYLVIGLALLGLGAGGVIVAVSKRLQRASTDTIVLGCALIGAVTVGVGYVVVASVSVNTLLVWRYTTASIENGAVLLGISLVLFASFLPAGIVLATLFGRRPEAVGRLYFADLAGAALACALAVPLMGSIGPPAAIMLSGAGLALAGSRIAWRRRKAGVGARSLAVAVGLTVVLLVVTIVPSVLPEVELDRGKFSPGISDTKLVYSSWSPLFRVDVREQPLQRFFIHDGLPGSVMKPWDGKQSSLRNFRFDLGPSALPFTTRPGQTESVLIIGAAAGNEILVSLDYKASTIDAVELNPVTYQLVTEEMVDYNGHVAEQPGVNYVNADGRSFLARSDAAYDLIWYPAPDSYSATNASSASAFVLAESYLYTQEAVTDSLDHLAPGGMLAAQFGEMLFDRFPNRTVRYLATVKAALAERGITDASERVIVATSPIGGFPDVSTILVKTDPFTPAEVDNFVATLPATTRLAYAPGRDNEPTAITRRIVESGPALTRYAAPYPFSVDAVTDTKPFFWHFQPFSKVVSELRRPIKGVNFEVAVGERALLLLLAIAVVLSGVFLLLPFVAVRDTWKRLPRKGRSAIYFAMIGLGFMAFEITLIQQLVLFLGYPTYSLTVTLSSLLIFVGLGAFLSRNVVPTARTLAAMAVAIVALTAFYLFGLTPVTEGLLDLALSLRIAVAFLLLAPLGLCLGMFMPLGIRAVAGLSDLSSEYVAWGWALNGFASVIGSVLATMLAMTYGFRVVLLLALAAYGVALVTLRTLGGRTPSVA